MKSPSDSPRIKNWQTLDKFDGTKLCVLANKSFKRQEEMIYVDRFPTWAYYWKPKEGLKP